MKLLGCKYQIYNGDELEIYRVVGYNTSKSIILRNQKTKEEKTVREQELTDKYVKLIPDAFMNIMITDHKDNPDVYACVNKASNLSCGKKTPDLLAKQSLYSINNIYCAADNNTIIFGDSVTEIDNGADLSGFMTFNNIDYTASVALYVDDDVDSIIDTIDNDTINKLDNELSYIKKKFSENNMGSMFVIKGYVDTFKDFLNNTNFITGYREIFNILQVQWPVDLGPQSYNKDGDLILNHKQQHELEDELRKHITNIKIIKYDKDIDVSKIVSLTHSMISDSNHIIYLIAYDVVSDYEPDSDIVKAMK